MLSALADILQRPSNLIGLLALFGLLALLLRWRRVGRSAVIFAAVLLVVCGWLPVGRMALGVLENRFPRPELGERVDGIIMLSGAADVPLSVERGAVALNGAAERITELAALAQRYPGARLIVSGSADEAGEPPSNEATLARDLLVTFGVPAARIELEDRSATTCQSPAEVEKIAMLQPGEVWLLVTSAAHMPRAVGCYEAAGFEVTPYPVDYRTRTGLVLALGAVGSNLDVLDSAAHEWVGLLGYWATGRIHELFPGPQPAAAD